MLLRLLPNRISWLAASLAVMLGSGACLAQEVGFVDLTQIVARTKLRRPATRSDEATDHRECRIGYTLAIWLSLQAICRSTPVTLCLLVSLVCYFFGNVAL